MDLLIIDDEIDICQMLQLPLVKAGHRVEYGHSVSDAREQLQQNNFNLCILDINLPDGSGFDILEMYAQTDTEFLMISAFEGNEELKQMESMGVRKFLKKPFKIREVLEVVEHLSS